MPRPSQPKPPAACKNATEQPAHAGANAAAEPQAKLGKPRGPLLQPPGVTHGRIAPSADLAAWVEHYWWVRWHTTEPQLAEVLSYPSLHVTFEGDEALIVGVVRRKFTRRLAGRGELFAVKFLPGMFRAWFGAPVVRLTDRTLPLGRQLGAPASLLLGALFAETDALVRAKVLEAHLRTRVPPHDADAELARDLVERVRRERAFTSVAELARTSGLTPRALERLFRDYVGVGPKWVIRRFRLQEAAELLETGAQTVGAVAATLGYFDQAHFDRDFKAVVGRTPSEYRRRARSASSEDSRAPQKTRYAADRSDGS